MDPGYLKASPTYIGHHQPELFATILRWLIYKRKNYRGMIQPSDMRIVSYAINFESLLNNQCSGM